MFERINVISIFTIILLCRLSLATLYFQKYTSVDNSGTKPVTQDIEIDTVYNVVVFRLSGDGITPGTFAIVDYTKV